MVNQTPVHQAKYKLLADIQKPRWRKQFICLVLIFLIVGSLFIIRAWVGIPTARSTIDFILWERGKNDQITLWSYRAWIYAESAKKNQNYNRNTAIEHVIESSKNSNEKILVCYISTKQIINGSQGLNPSLLDPKLCTHIIVGFASIENCTLNLGNSSWFYQEVADLRKLERSLKVMMSVGGINEFNSGYPEMAKTRKNRKIFIESVLNITKTLGLDGLDIDWEFPAWSGSNYREKMNFVQLLQELRVEFDKSGRKLLLTAAVAAPGPIIDQSYNVPGIVETVDFVNVMTYDYHMYIWYYPVTGLNSPLFPRSVESGYLATLNINFSANYWISKGMPREKIVIGIPTYGHSYKLANPLNHDVQAPAKGFGSLGENSFVMYSTICQFLRDGAVSIFLNDSLVPYAYKNDEWISYEDIRSVTEKVKWIRNHNFKGAMILSLNCDDWASVCSENVTFPLIRAVKSALN